MPELDPEEDILFVVLNSKQSCPLLQRETPSLSSWTVNHANNLEKAIKNKASPGLSWQGVHERPIEHYLLIRDSIHFFIHLIVTISGIVQKPCDLQLWIACQSLGEAEGKSKGCTPFVKAYCSSLFWCPAIILSSHLTEWRLSATDALPLHRTSMRCWRLSAPGSSPQPKKDGEVMDWYPSFLPLTWDDSVSQVSIETEPQLPTLRATWGHTISFFPSLSHFSTPSSFWDHFPICTQILVSGLLLGDPTQRYLVNLIIHYIRKNETCIVLTVQGTESKAYHTQLDSWRYAKDSNDAFWERGRSMERRETWDQRGQDTLI